MQGKVEKTRQASLAAGTTTLASRPTVADPINAHGIPAMRGADLKSLLHSAFGFSAFRPSQEAVCRGYRPAHIAETAMYNAPLAGVACLGHMAQCRRSLSH